jgi:ubiquitin carboxyl-terminal hydrolase 8
MLEDSLTVAPRIEESLFSNRDKFDVVAIYDQSSTSTGLRNSPMSNLVRVIYEQSFRKILKNMPMLLVGGLEAWRQEFGDTEVIHGAPETLHPEVQKQPIAAQSPMLPSVDAMPLPTPDPHQLWTPRLRPDTTGTLEGKWPSQGEERPSYSQIQPNTTGTPRFVQQIVANI